MQAIKPTNAASTANEFPTVAIEAPFPPAPVVIAAVSLAIVVELAAVVVCPPELLIPVVALILPVIVALALPVIVAIAPTLVCTAVPIVAALIP